MSSYVLIMSIGPVQGFIASARKSRDLWSGSWLLSELAKSAARYLHQQSNVELIFPAPEKPLDDLKFNSDFSVGNKIQIVVNNTDHHAVQQLAKDTAEIVRAQFRKIAEEAKSRLKNDKAIRLDIWDLQVNDYVEVQSAWARYEQSNQYGSAVKKASSALAARKATRDFPASAHYALQNPLFGLPKSSLDGARETVLQENIQLVGLSRRKLGLNQSEQLDTAGIAKRLGGNPEQFTAFSRIAAHSWIESLSDQQAKLINQAYAAVVDIELATRVSGNKGQYAKLPFDAQYLYPFRLEAAILEHKFDSKVIPHLLALQKVLKPIWTACGSPCPYGVILLADGDRMGELLDNAQNKAQHQQITQGLSKFAGSVEQIVQNNQGHAIYAGGDDVLAFVPLNNAVACAIALKNSFSADLGSISKALGAVTPTLSVGLAIGHIMQPLGDIRELAKSAEKEAKGDHVKDKKLQRNALGIALDVRSGSEVRLRIRWDDEEALKDFDHWQKLYANKEIPSRVAYDTRAIYLRTKFVDQLADTEDQIKQGIPAAEFQLMLSRANTAENGKLSPEVINRLQNRRKMLGTLDLLANELIVARWLAAKLQKDLG